MKRSPEEILEKMDLILDEYDAANDKYDRDQFSSKYGDRLSQYSDKLKTLNGDDFDIVSSAYDEHKSSYPDMDDESYVTALEENIKSVIQRIWPDASPEEVEQAAEDVQAAVEEQEGNTDTAEIPEEATSDANAKADPNDTTLSRHKGRDGQKFWGNPRYSGGREGTTSDEEEKKDPEDKDDAKEIVSDVVDKALDSNPAGKAAEVAVEIATAKPEEVKGNELEEAYTFNKKDPLYRMSH